MAEQLRVARSTGKTSTKVLKKIASKAKKTNLRLGILISSSLSLQSRK
jgi:hypothetical protein